MAETLPNRRVEGWRWSDLSAALAGRDVKLAPGGGHVIARLAGGPSRLVVAPGETRIVVDRMPFGMKGGALDASALDVEIGAGGSLTLVLLQGHGDVALAHRRVGVGAGATFRQFVLAEGAKFARIETQVDVSGANAQVEMNGVWLAAAGRHADMTSDVVLNAEAGLVRQLVRGAARKGGRGVFQGRFKVERAAQKTDARMAHNSLLLEEGAEVFAKPELEIYADDVQCAHGNTAGQIDEMAVFYLRSRGLPEIEARAMITRAFLIEAVPEWLEADVREEIAARIDAWLRSPREDAP